MLFSHSYFNLSPDNNLLVQIHPMSFYTNYIKNNDLHFIKLNHVYFEALYWLNNKHEKIEAAEMLRLHDESLLRDVENIIRSVDKTKIILGVSNIQNVPNFKWGKNKGSRILDHINAKVVKELIPDGYIPHSASVWKYFCVTNEINYFIEEVKKHSVVVVGMDHLKELVSIFPNLRHFILTFESCVPENRQKVLDSLYEYINDGVKKVVLFQAGEPFSTWLIYKLSKDYKVENCSMIDMGRALDYFCPNRKMIESDKKKCEGLYQDFNNQRWMNLKFN